MYPLTIKLINNPLIILIMLDIKLVRENPEIIKKDLEKRDRIDKIQELKEVQELDKRWRSSLQEVEQLKKERNIISKEISELKKKGEDASEKLELVKNIPTKIKGLEEGTQEFRKKINKILMNMPNILHDSVPTGLDDTQNVVVKEYGVKPKFDFEPKSHVDILESHDIADIERAGKISGARWYFLLGDLVLLDFALQKLGLDIMYNRGYQLVYPPFAMNRNAYEGVTDLSDFEEVMYKIEDEDLYMIATSEHPLTARFQNEVIDETNLPMKFAGISACFRKEAGSHGKDTKGIFRVHQFNKIEQIVICKQEESWDFIETQLQNAIDIFEALKIPFRVVNVCTGDMGTVAAKKYDLEAWMPVQKTYREMVSCSNCTDYQARRLNIRYRTKDGNKVAHTLNSTAIATSRAMVAIMENFQDEEGNVHVPEVLWPYMNGVKVIKAKSN